MNWRSGETWLVWLVITHCHAARNFSPGSLGGIYQKRIGKRVRYSYGLRLNEYEYIWIRDTGLCGANREAIAIESSMIIPS